MKVYLSIIYLSIHLSFHLSIIYPSIYHPSTYLSIYLTHIYHILFTYLPVDEHLGHFHLLAIANNTSMNVGVEISVQVSVFSSFKHMSRDRINGSHGNLIFHILKNLHTGFHRGYTILLSYQQCIRAPIAPHICQHLLFPVCVLVSCFYFAYSSHPNCMK